MASQKEGEVSTYTLNIQSIKMKIKFACKMKLEYDSQFLTSEVSPNQAGKFIFNQETTLTQNNKNSFEITAHLNTEKGAKYIAGIIKLHATELANQEGETILVPLSKCLDPEATCELRVDQVSTEKVMRHLQIDKSAMQRGVQNHIDYSPTNLHSASQLNLQKPNYGTKSEYQFPLNSSRKPSVREWGNERSRKQGMLNIAYRSPNNIRTSAVAASYVEFVDETMNRDKLIEAEVYKENYEKLKYKYKREVETARHQMNRRIALENNENNYKLETMRLRLKIEELEKFSNERALRAKELQLQLSNLQTKEIDLAYLKQENDNKDYTISILQDTIKTLNSDNDDLKRLNRQRFGGEHQKMKELREELEKTKQKLFSKETDAEKELRTKNEVILQKQSEIRMRDDRMQRQERLIQELEKAAKAKMLDQEKSLRNERLEWKQKFEESVLSIQKLESEIRRFEQELKDSKNESEKLRSNIVKFEYDKKMLNQEIEDYKGELVDLKAYKEKYMELVREHKLLTEDKNHLQKQLDKTLQYKELNAFEINRQHTEDIEHYKKLIKDTEDKYRNLQTKNSDLENQVEQKKIQLEKAKRNNESLNREISDLKEKEKTLKKAVKSKEQVVATLNDELQESRKKNKSGDQMFKYQLDNLNEENHRLKRELESQTAKMMQLSDKNAKTNEELIGVKLKLQHADETSDKTIGSFKQKVESLESQIRDQERKLNEANSTILSQKAADREGQQRSQKQEIDMIKSTEKCNKYERELRNLEETVKSLEHQATLKQRQFQALTASKEGVEAKLLETEEKLSNIKNSYNVLTGQNNKNETILQMLTEEVSQSKQEVQKLQTTLSNQEKYEEGLRKEMKQCKQDNLQADLKFNNLKRDYERFKDQLNDTINNCCDQLPSLPGFEMRTSYSIVSGGRGGDEESNASIIRHLNSQFKQIQSSMTKMMDQNNTLKNVTSQLNKEISNIGKKTELQTSKLEVQVQDLQHNITSKQNELEEVKTRLETENTQLNLILQDKQNLIEELQTQIEELNFTVNSLSMDNEANNEHSFMIQNQLKAKISELEEQRGQWSQALEEYERKQHELEGRLNESNSALDREIDANRRKDKTIELISADKNALQASLDEAKKSKKQLIERVSQLELKFNAAQDFNSKTKQQLFEEERKGTQLKEFVSNLMKQKENAIRNELAKSQEIIKLEMGMSELKRDLEMQSEETERQKKANSDLKQLNKKLGQQIKQIEVLEVDEKGRLLKTHEQLREAEKDLKNCKQELEDLQIQHLQSEDKHKIEISQFERQLEEKNKQMTKLVNEYSEKLSSTNREYEESSTSVMSLKAEITHLEEQLFTEKQALEVKKSENERFMQESQESNEKLKNINELVNSLNEEVREKQENNFQLSGKIISLESRLEQQEVEGNLKLENLIEDYQIRYDSINDEYSQRIKLVEKERDYYKQRIEQIEEDHRKTVAELRSMEADDSNFKKNLQDKIRRLEQDRLAVITSKNNEIQRISSESKMNFEALKAKEAEIRRVQHELEVARTSISKLNDSKIETEEKIRNINRVYQKEIEQFKRKEANHRSSRESLNRTQYEIERQFKKLMQGFVRSAISGEQRQSVEKLIGLSKGLEEDIERVISEKLSDK